MTNIAERMTDAAEENLGLPYSLMCDAWDRCEFRLNSLPVTAEMFDTALALALDAWEADRRRYQFNARALPLDPEAERIAGIVRYLEQTTE